MIDHCLMILFLVYFLIFYVVVRERVPTCVYGNKLKGTKTMTWLREELRT